MKKNIALFIASLFVAFTSFSQNATKENSQYTTIMAGFVKQVDTASTASTLMDLANTFERIGKAEKTKWLPFYYASYCYAMLAVKSEPASIDQLADRAESLLQVAEGIDGNNSEITSLFAMIHSSRIMVDPVARFQTYGKEVHALLGKAKVQNPNNPRIYFLEARLLSKTPEMFGGGRKVAKESADISVSKFNSFQPENAIVPHWGGAQAKDLANKLSVQ